MCNTSFSWNFDLKIQLWEMGVIRGTQGVNHTPPPPPKGEIAYLQCVVKWYPAKMCQQQSFVIITCTPNGFGIYKNPKSPVFFQFDLASDLEMTWGDTPVKHSTNSCHLSYPILYPYVVMGAEAKF